MKGLDGLQIVEDSANPSFAATTAMVHIVRSGFVQAQHVCKSLLQPATGGLASLASLIH